jgi:hypothetical protein
MDLKKMFNNHFATDKMDYISDEELKDFSQDGIGRITANNGGGLFTTMLADTVAAHTTYFGAITDKDIKFAVQQSLTMSKDNIVRTFKQTVSDKSGIIQGSFEGGVNAPEYQEFFPLGLTEYANATMGNIELLMSRMVTASSNHALVLGPAFIAIWPTIQSNYNTARSLQQNKMGEVGVAREAVDTNRLPLELQWCKNLHFIGYTYPGQPDICATFFNQSLLKNKKVNTNPISGTLLPNAHKVLFKGTILKAGSTFNANTSSPDSGFWLYSATTTDEPYTGPGIYIGNAAEINNINWSQLGGQKPIVKIYNPNALDAKFEVEVV